MIRLRTVCLAASLLALPAIASPALCQDGRHDAQNAVQSAKALELYLDGLLKSGQRPDYTTPPASGLFHQIFDTEELAALPPVQPGDVSWLLAWSKVAGGSIKLLISFGVKPGPDLDRQAMAQNMVEYEDQYAAATSFVIRLEALQATALDLFRAQLAPEQLTPVREAGFRIARQGAGKLIANAIVSISEGAKPVNARLVTAALRDTRVVWARFILPEDRNRIVAMIRSDDPMPVKDDEVQRNLAALAAALAAAN